MYGTETDGKLVVSSAEFRMHRAVDKVEESETEKGGTLFDSADCGTLSLPVGTAEVHPTEGDAKLVVGGSDFGIPPAVVTFKGYGSEGGGKLLVGTSDMGLQLAVDEVEEQETEEEGGGTLLDSAD